MNKAAISIVEKLERKAPMFPVTGGAGIGKDASGKVTVTSYITDDGLRLANPDGPEAAAIIMEMVEALEECRAKFREYELLHLAKYTEEGDEKAARNREMKEMCDSLLTKVRGK